MKRLVWMGVVVCLLALPGFAVGADGSVTTVDFTVGSWFLDNDDWDTDNDGWGPSHQPGLFGLEVGVQPVSSLPVALVAGGRYMRDEEMGVKYFPNVYNDTGSYNPDYVKNARYTMEATEWYGGLRLPYKWPDAPVWLWLAGGGMYVDVDYEADNVGGPGAAMKDVSETATGGWGALGMTMLFGEIFQVGCAMGYKGAKVEVDDADLDFDGLYSTFRVGFRF